MIAADLCLMLRIVCISPEISYIAAGSVSDPDPDPYGSVSFGRIRVASKINQNHGINKSKWFVNVLFT